MSQAPRPLRRPSWLLLQGRWNAPDVRCTACSYLEKQDVLAIVRCKGRD